MNTNSVLKNMESAPQERAYLKNEETEFDKEVLLAKENLKNSLEISSYVEKAKALLLKYSAEELMNMGKTNREELDNLCGNDSDSSVIVAICFYLEKQTILGQHN